MNVENVFITYMDRSQNEFKIGGKFEEQTITDIEIDELNAQIKLIIDDNTVVGFPMSNIFMYIHENLPKCTHVYEE